MSFFATFASSSWLSLIDPTAFYTAATATLKVFLMGAAGYYLIWRRLLVTENLGVISALVGNLTLPCMIFHRFAVEFDPVKMPNWWVMALAGTALQLFQIGLGYLISRRYSPEQGRDEMTMLLGYQNSGFFVLPMLQALLPTAEFNRIVVLLFIFIIFFNASAWPMGTWVLLKQKKFDLKRLLLLPPMFWTIVALMLFGPLRPLASHLNDTMVWQALIGGESPGAVQMIGDLTVPLATLVLGGTIAQTAARGLRGFENKRGSFEIAFWKLAFLPLLGWLLITYWPTPLFEQDRALRLLIMLEFAAPPAMNVAVFCQQFGYRMRLTPAACLLAYALCIGSVPFWVALVL